MTAREMSFHNSWLLGSNVHAMKSHKIPHLKININKQSTQTIAFKKIYITVLIGKSLYEYWLQEFMSILTCDDHLQSIEFLFGSSNDWRRQRWYRGHPVQCHRHMPLLRAGPSPGSVTNNSNGLAGTTLRQYPSTFPALTPRLGG